jgi:hypothetical protein
MHSLKELHEQPLNDQVAADLFDLYACVPTCKTARDIFVSVVLKCPPMVRLQSMPGGVSKELELLLDHQWRNWAESLYDWIKMFGICPYLYRRVPGTVHW